MPFKYIGRTIDFKGKTLWEIVGNLKNFGVGRIVARNMFERYPEPCYMKIVKVETLPSPEVITLDDVRKVKVTVQRTFRGRTMPNLVDIESASYKCDYKLIPKEEEAAYCKFDGEVSVDKILPKYIDFPPLMKALIMKEMAAKGDDLTEEPKLEVVCKGDALSFYRKAQDGETPTVEIGNGIGTPAAPSLYKGIEL